MKSNKSYLALKIILTILPLWGLGGCSGDFTYSKYRCYLVIDNAMHQDATLASAMNCMAPGTFCQIVANETGKKYAFKNNLGVTSESTFTGIDQRLTRILGLNNALIVGFGSLTDEFYAYDRECPNCFDPDAVPVRSKPLTMDGNGNATCSVCKRQYSMNTGGNCISEGGVSGMTRYRCGTTGPFGQLTVGN